MNRACNLLTNIIAVIILSSTGTIIMGNNIYDWKIIETLAERHPYIVALLNNTKNYACTGVIIDHRSILTSGACVHPEPLYVAVGSAIAGQRTNDNNIFKIAYTKAHEDFFFELGRNYNVTRMHSNIALVFTVKPVLLYFCESAILGNYFESELKDKKLSTTGYGELRNALTVLQHQRYRQVACTNPKWYYCICGIESSVDTTYDLYFGEGGPVFYGDEVIGISSFPSGLMRLKDDVRYNVFTVISPYLEWIKKQQRNEFPEFRHNGYNKCKHNVHVVFLIAIKLILWKYCASYYFNNISYLFMYMSQPTSLISR
ncbi:unnamed protein product [Pieris macdunnoughi]|uniref:Peptidase S1 domain-containing protein n=1 Tax=Pieris macdunnoughi TaxID=345717 RepID=A0A821NBS7_9NEOP|nr:unnamed protein product [Pieris macdunnoughi]